MSVALDRPLLDMKQAAEYLNVSYNWLQQQAAGDKVPHTRLGRRVLFAAEHLDAIVKSGERQVATTTPQTSRPRRRRAPRR